MLCVDWICVCGEASGGSGHWLTLHVSDWSLGAGASPMTPSSSSPLAPPPNGVAPPPLHPGKKPRRRFSSGRDAETNLMSWTPPLSLAAHPPPASVATPPPPLGPMRSQREANSSRSESEPDIEGVVLVLNQALAACRQTVKVSVDLSDLHSSRGRYTDYRGLWKVELCRLDKIIKQMIIMKNRWCAKHSWKLKKRREASTVMRRRIITAGDRKSQTSNRKK